MSDMLGRDVGTSAGGLTESESWVGAIVFARWKGRYYLALGRNIEDRWTFSKVPARLENPEAAVAKAIKEDFDLVVFIKLWLKRTVPSWLRVCLVEAQYKPFPSITRYGAPYQELRWFPLEEILELNFYDLELPILTAAVEHLLDVGQAGPGGARQASQDGRSRTVRELAAELHWSVPKMLSQLLAAGVNLQDAESTISAEDEAALFAYLKDKRSSGSSGRRRITNTRGETGSPQSRGTPPRTRRETNDAHAPAGPAATRLEADRGVERAEIESRKGPVPTNREVQPGADDKVRGSSTIEGPARTNSEAQPGERNRQSDVVTNSSGWERLPPPLAERYDIIGRLPATGAQADLYLVKDKNNAEIRFAAKIYHFGITPKEDILKKLKQSSADHVIRLIDYSTHGERSWELLEYAEHGSLRNELERQGKNVSTNWIKYQLLKELNDALLHIHSLGLEHRDLKPDNILVRTREPLDLALTDFGIASVMDATSRFTTAHKTARYAPPEAGAVWTEKDRDGGRTTLKSRVYRTRFDYWSLGILLVEVLTGRNPFEGMSEANIISSLATMATDDLVQFVSDPDWKKLCRGLLRRDPKLRWGGEEVARWLKNPSDPTLVVPEEASVRQPPGLRFLGREYTTPEGLADALAANWEKAADFWRRDENYEKLLNWMLHDLGLESQAATLKFIRGPTEILPLDAQLFSVIQRLNPSRTPSYQGQELTRENLKALADVALAEPYAGANVLSLGAPAKPSAGAIMLSLRRNRVLQIARHFEGHETLGKIFDAQDAAVAEYERIRQQVAQGTNGEVAAPALDDRLLVTLLAAATPASNAKEQLLATAQAGVGEDARRCLWFASLCDRMKASSAAALAVRELVHTATNRGQTELRERNYLAAVPEYGVALGAVLGASGGILIGLLWNGTAGLIVGVLLSLWTIYSGPTWIETPTRDPRTVKAKAIGLIVLAVVVVVAYSANWWQHKVKSERIGKIITSTSFHNSAGDLITGTPPTIFEPWSRFVFRANYYDEKADADKVEIAMGNGRERACRFSQLDLSSKYGSLACNIQPPPPTPSNAPLVEGSNMVSIFINESLVGSYPFRVVDSSRVHRIIQAVKIARKVNNGRPNEDTRRLYGGTGPVGIYLEYQNALNDTLSVSLLRNGKDAGSCKDSVLNANSRGVFSGGNYWCQWDSLGVGHYQFKVSINGISVGPHDFSISE